MYVANDLIYRYTNIGIIIINYSAIFLRWGNLSTRKGSFVPLPMDEIMLYYSFIRRPITVEIHLCNAHIKNSEAHVSFARAS